jgi:hypothetical protein
MRSGLFRASMLFVVAALFFSAASVRAQSSSSASSGSYPGKYSASESTNSANFEALLIWGTNDKQSDPKLKPADPKLVEKLKRSPFKWDHYYEMHKEPFKLRLNEEKTLTMSRNCVISVTYLKEENVKFQLIGKGVLANTVTQALPKGRLLITGGDAENSTAWFVVLKQVE